MYRYYEHFHKSEISKSWNELMESSDKAFPQSLALFYDTVVSTFHTQVCLVCVTLQYQFYNYTVVSTFHTQVCLVCVTLQYQFYNDSLSALVQVSWCSGVFTDPIHVVCQMIAVSLESLEKTMGSSITQYLDSEDSALYAITQLKQVSFSTCELFLSRITCNEFSSSFKMITRRLL